MLSPPGWHDDEKPQLSPEAVLALNEFYGDRETQRRHLEDLHFKAKDDFRGERLCMAAFAEDWNSSQFWYSEETALALATGLLQGIDSDSCIAVISAPSVFIQLKNLLARDSREPKPQIYLLEYDKRFSVFREFVQYDFARPLDLPAGLKGRCDRILCDPPYLSSDCQAKVALTIRSLARCWIAPSKPGQGDLSIGLQLVLCTGEVMHAMLERLYRKVGLRITSFEPQHANGLSNEFKCFANFESETWGWSRERICITEIETA